MIAGRALRRAQLDPLQVPLAHHLPSPKLVLPDMVLGGQSEISALRASDILLCSYEVTIQKYHYQTLTLELRTRRPLSAWLSSRAAGIF